MTELRLANNGTWWVVATWYEGGVHIAQTVAGPYLDRAKAIAKVKEWNACPKRVHEELLGTKEMPDALHFRVSGTVEVAGLLHRAKRVTPKEGHIEPDIAS